MKLFRKLLSLVLVLLMVTGIMLPSGMTVSAAGHTPRPKVTEISVQKQPDTTEYQIGQKLSFDGMKVKIDYSDHSSRVIDAADLADKGITATPAEGTVLTTEGKNTVTLAYGELTATFDINVSPITVAAITVNTPPTVTEYHLGQKLSFDGMTVKIHYSDGSSNIVSAADLADKDITATPAEGTVLTIEGKNTVTLAYGELTATFDINVSPITVAAITVNTPPTVTEYHLGEKLSFDGMTVKIHYSDGSSNIVSAADLADKDITATPAEGTVLTTEGKNTVTLAYDELTATFDINVSAEESNGREIDRLYGSDRFATAIAVSGEGWDSAQNVIIAGGSDFADALAGISLAKALDAPILLASAKDNSALYAEIGRLGAKNVYILGGTGVVDSSVENTLSAAGLDVTRLSGADRYATAVAIAKALSDLSGAFDKAFIVSGESYADALSAGYAAAMTGSPVLYTNSDMLNSATGEFIVGAGITEVKIIGGSGAVSEAVAEKLSTVADVDRIGGTDRYATSLAVAKSYYTGGGDGLMTAATGKNFPDALTGGALACRLGVPVLLVGDSASEDLVRFLEDCGTERIIIFGGESAVSSEIADALK